MESELQIATPTEVSVGSIPDWAVSNDLKLSDGTEGQFNVKGPHNWEQTLIYVD